MLTGYKQLKAGDVRQERDEYRRIGLPVKSYIGRTSLSTDPWRYGPWTLVNLVGHAILQSDLMGHEFRRPLI
jgi:hypothetical protein